MLKRPFYPKSKVEKILQGTSPKKVSRRVNELIFKGAAKEKDEEIADEYKKFDKLMARQVEKFKIPKKKLSISRLSVSKPALRKLFESEGEEDWY